jgi:hypothetical protein
MGIRMWNLAYALLPLAALVYVVLELRAIRRESDQFRAKYLDALASITARAEAAEQLAQTQAHSLHAFRDSIGDRKLAEGLAAQIVYLQERLTESQRAVVTLTDLRAGQAVVRQAREIEPEPAVTPREPLWRLASGKAPKLSVEQLRRVSSTLKAPHGD